MLQIGDHTFASSAYDVYLYPRPRGKQGGPIGYPKSMRDRLFELSSSVRHMFRIASYCVALLAIGTAWGASTATASQGKLIAKVESVYNTILLYRRGDYVTMTFGYNKRLYTESKYNTKDELELPVKYTRYMTAGLAFADKIERILEIGAGGARTAWYLHRHMPETRITSVELDPAVINLAKKHFGIREEPGIELVQRDGRVFLMRTKETYDAVLVDAYRGPFVPFHLMTREFYELAKRRMATGGVLVQNVAPDTMLFDAAVATVKSVFDHVEFFVAGKNVVTVAYDGKRKTAQQLYERAAALQQRHNFSYDMPDLIERRRMLADPPEHEPLTDDFAPVETLKAVEKHNAKWVLPRDAK